MKFIGCKVAIWSLNGIIHKRIGFFRLCSAIFFARFTFDAWDPLPSRPWTLSKCCLPIMILKVSPFQRWKHRNDAPRSISSGLEHPGTLQLHQFIVCVRLDWHRQLKSVFSTPHENDSVRLFLDGEIEPGLICPMAIRKSIVSVQLFTRLTCYRIHRCDKSRLPINFMAFFRLLSPLFGTVRLSYYVIISASLKFHKTPINYWENYLSKKWMNEKKSRGREQI